jgi:hypothetical protein
MTNRIRAAVLCAAALLASGCINYEQRTHLRDDGSGDMEIHYWTKESAVTWLSGEPFKFDEAEIERQYGGSNATVESAKAETNDADSTRHVRVRIAFKDINTLSETPAFRGVRFSFRVAGDSMFFRQEHDANSSANGLGLDRYTVTYAYDLPGDVVRSNATRVDGTTLVWRYKLSDLSNSVALTATMVRRSSSIAWLPWVAGIVFLAAIGALFAVRRKKPPQPQTAGGTVPAGDEDSGPVHQ